MICPPSPCLSIRGRKICDSVHHAANQYAESPVPVVKFRKLDRTKQTYACVVAENMNFAEYPLRLIRSPGERLAIRNIQFEAINAFPLPI